MSKSADHNRRNQNTGRHNAPCPATPTKRRYRDGDEAKRALNNMKRLAQSELSEKGSTMFNQVRAYECNACKGWHTTSQLTSSIKNVAVKTEAQSMQQMLDMFLADEITEAQKS